MKRISTVAVAFLSTVLSAASFADGFYLAHVTALGPTRVGIVDGTAAIYFQVDISIGSACPVGATWLWYAPNSNAVDKVANTKAALSSLQLAYALGKPINMYVLTASCQVIYFTNQL